ncbi:hypothetical protein BJX61DRAFT_543858 [Aspergillus egyptiacus]|nr:hypothetical protein BJX61DRAFT_543858 [Aspergillus egyptiacus]
MARKRPSSPAGDPESPRKKAHAVETTGTMDGKGNNAPGSTAGCVSTDPNEIMANKLRPYTAEFFSDLAEEVTRSFPFDAFARSQGCDVADVIHAVNATIVEPLSRPTRVKPVSSIAEPTQTAEGLIDKISPTKLKTSGRAAARSWKTRLGQEEPRTAVHISKFSGLKKGERRRYSRGFLERLRDEARPKPKGEFIKTSESGSPASRRTC